MMEGQAERPWWRRLLASRGTRRRQAPRPDPGLTDLGLTDLGPRGQAVDGDGPDVGPPPDGGARDPDVDLAVASAVLTVASRLTSAELRRRLTESVSLLPDVTVVFPAAGEKFNPDLHTWKASTPASATGAAETIAETRSAGLLDHRGAVRRRADVVVYDTTEDNL
jgi:hypothetical protein